MPLPRGMTDRQLVDYFKKRGCKVVVPAPSGGLGATIMKSPGGQIFGIPNAKGTLYERALELLEQQLRVLGLDDLVR